MKKILIIILMILPLVGCVSKSEKKRMLDDIFNNTLSSFLFVDETYLSEDDLILNNDVALALNLLDGEYEYDFEGLLEDNNTTISDVKQYYLNRDIRDVSTAYNMCIVYELLDLDKTKLVDYFNSDFEYADWQYSTVLSCLKMLDTNKSLETELQTIIINSFTDGSYNDADTIAMKIMSLGTKTPNNAKVMLKEYITKDGVLGYDSESNLCSTAYTVIALLCMGEDLCCNYNYDGINIEDILFAFYSDNAFKNKQSDADVDLKYASPQGFLALSALYVCHHCVLELY